MPSPERLVINTSPLLACVAGCGSLDKGEAAVIQLAINEGIGTVCIDETVGRRLARLCGLQVTGSIGLLLRAKREGRLASMRQTVDQMRTRGIWLSDAVVAFALRESGEG